MPNSEIIAGTDIGTSKTTVFIAEARTGTGGMPRVIARGEAPSNGIKKGTILNVDTLRDCVNAAFDSAEKQAGLRVKNTWLTLSGTHLLARRVKGAAAIADTRGVVRKEDVNRACAEARRVHVLPGDEFPNHIAVFYLRQPFRLDRNIFINPVGQIGQTLESSYWAIAADKRRIKLMLELVAGHAEDPEFVAASVTSGSLLSTPDTIQHGLLVADIGAGTTDFVLYQHGCVVMTGVLPIGGDHITNDIAEGLRLDRAKARELQHTYDPALLSDPAENPTVWQHGDNRINDRKIPLRSVDQIIRARVDELFRFIMARVTRNGQVPATTFASGIILTGGVANLRGIAQIATEVSGIGVRPLEFPAWVRPEDARPEYSAALGLLVHAQRRLSKTAVPAKPGVFKSITRWLGI